MKQSVSKREQTAGLYLRLSRDDKQDGESYSISNQRKLLEKTAKEKGYSRVMVFLDDGISGTTMNRPGFIAMIEAIEQGKISAVFVKDMSRLARNYLQAGYYTDEYFPDHGIRFVAVSDGVDTDEGEDDITPFRNIMNEWYARDISRKVKAAKKTIGEAGIPLSTQVPYGYIRNPDDSRFWIVDEEPAQVVRRIFNMAAEGMGVDTIASTLESE